MAAGKLVFAVNGERFEIAEVDPSTTLLEFLRTRSRFTGPKLGCGEGGCGACVVFLSKYDPISGQVNGSSVSSCLTLLCSINLCSVTTTEGLGNSKDGFHSSHQRFAGFHASQCGFCTPGMCMSLFSALNNADNTNRPEPPRGFSKIRKYEAEKAISGNLCRCTGFRPIADVCKSFAADVDLEDLGFNIFWEKPEDANVERLPPYNQHKVCTFPEFLKCEINSSMNTLKSSKDNGSLECQWYRPASFEELYELLNSSEFIESHVKMVVGNTMSGVYKEINLFDKYISLTGIPELSIIERNSKGFTLGAAVTISKAIEVLKERDGHTLNSEGELVFGKIAEHMDKVATPFVRNMASLGGNLIMAQRYQFPSDIATILLAAGSTVCLQMPSERVILSLEEFLEGPPYDDRTILISIHIPYWSSASNSSFGTSKYNIIFETYRAAPRPLGNAVSYLNSAFLAHVASDKFSGDIVLLKLHLAFGAYGTEHAIRARKVENFLVGKVLTVTVLIEAIKLLKEIIVPKEGTSHPRYRISLAVAFLFKFFQPLTKDLAQVEKNNLHIPDVILSSKQVVEFSTENFPVGKPIKKVAAEIQASGEALYVDDIPSSKDCLYGAFIYSTQPFARIKGITFNSTLVSSKIVAYISINDIPEGGKNIGSSFTFDDEPLFADSLTEYSGQCLGIVVAETQRYANMAAKQAIVHYSTEGLEPPILSVEDAARRSSFFDIPPSLYPAKVGDLARGMDEADHKILSAEVKLESEHYFYMETQTAFAIPDEDDCIVVYSSTQYPEGTQGVIAKCLGIPQHNVRVITRRVGGGFGGKATRSNPIATACALTAFKLRCPIKMYLDRSTDMVMVGGRHPMKVTYSVGFKSNGKITALYLNLLVNAGISEDYSPLIARAIITCLEKYNWGALAFDIKLCKTNLTSKSSMRAPGEVQGSYIAEAIIEHVASFLSLDVDVVRKRNLHTYESLKLFYGSSSGESPEYTLPAIVDELFTSASYFNRLEMVSHFNSCNKWRKRGISWVPIVYEVEPLPTPGKVSILNDGSIVVEVGGVEIGQGLWTKVKQMAAFGLEQLWDEGRQHLLDRVRIIQADTLSLVQGGFTAGSTKSEASCQAVRLACSILVSRLKPLKQRLEEQMGSISWDTLITQANLQYVNLSASTYWVPQDTSSYLNYGAAISEVEIDVLTGATTILRADLTYDCGQSLSPAVDLGQIEGSFVQGIGFFVCEKLEENSDGLVTSDGTWTYKIPSVDTIPKNFNIRVMNSGHHKDRVLSSKASGEPPLLLAASVHSAIRKAIRSARADFSSTDPNNSSVSSFQFDPPATMTLVKELCGLDTVEKYLEALVPTTHGEV